MEINLLWPIRVDTDLVGHHTHRLRADRLGDGITLLSVHNVLHRDGDIFAHCCKGGGARLGVLLHSLNCAVLLRVLRMGVAVRGWWWVAILGGWDREDGSNQHQGQGQGLGRVGKG